MPLITRIQVVETPISMPSTQTGPRSPTPRTTTTPTSRMPSVIWLAGCEVSVERGDLPSGATKAFTRITTWADSLETLRTKVSRYLESYSWHLLDIESAAPIGDPDDYDDETIDMIARTRTNPSAIILGRFFSYKEN